MAKPTTTKKRRPSNSRPDVYQCYDKCNDMKKRRYRCKFCFGEFSHNLSTLINHINRCKGRNANGKLIKCDEKFNLNVIIFWLIV